VASAHRATSEYAAQFDAIYPRLAKQFGVQFYPFILDGVALNPKLNQADGIHPAGVKIIVGHILPDVLKLVGSGTSPPKSQPSARPSGSKG